MHKVGKCFFFQRISQLVTQEINQTGYTDNPLDCQKLAG